MAQLEKLALTNGESALLTQIASFLEFMKSYSCPVPADDDEMDALLTAYIKHDRREQMQRISDMRVARGESPLANIVTDEEDEEEDEEEDLDPYCRQCGGRHGDDIGCHNAF